MHTTKWCARHTINKSDLLSRGGIQAPCIKTLSAWSYRWTRASGALVAPQAQLQMSHIWSTSFSVSSNKSRDSHPSYTVFLRFTSVCADRCTHLRAWRKVPKAKRVHSGPFSLLQQCHMGWPVQCTKVCSAVIISDAIQKGQFFQIHLFIMIFPSSSFILMHVWSFIPGQNNMKEKKKKQKQTFGPKFCRKS